jgi:hypothetical protein
MTEGHVRTAALRGEAECTARDQLPALDAGEVLKAAARLFGAETPVSEEGDGFAVLPSVSRPRLLLPVDCRRAASQGLNMYHDESLRGRLRTALARALIRIGPRRYCRKAIGFRSGPGFIGSLVRATMGEDAVCAVWLGNPDRFWKIIVQVMRRSGEIIGYLKVPMTAESEQRVRAEARVLERLSAEPGICASVPRPLYAANWNGAFMLLMSACPGEINVSTPSEFHRQFLQRLHQLDPVAKPGSVLVSEVRSKCRRLAENSDLWRAVSERALDFAADALDGRQVDCSFSHGDFAPQNTLLDNGWLYVVDWELAGPGKPSAWDLFHFGVRPWRGDVHPRCLPEPRDREGKASYVLYLLDSAGSLAEGGKDVSDSGIQLRLRLVTELVRSWPPG